MNGLFLMSLLKAYEMSNLSRTSQDTDLLLGLNAIIFISFS